MSDRLLKLVALPVPLVEELLLAAQELVHNFADDLPAGQSTRIPNHQVVACRDAIAAVRQAFAQCRLPDQEKP